LKFRVFVRSNWLLLSILLISVLLRLGAAFFLGNEVEELPGTADQISYHTLAQRVLAGHGFTFGEPWWPATRAGEPTAHWSYLYTGFLILIYGLLGPNPLAARLIQALLVGLLQPLFAYLLGERLFGQRVGLAAAAITAVYAYFVYYAANLMTESFYIVCILAAIWLAIRWTDRMRSGASPEMLTPALLGLVLGAAVLLRQLFLLVVPLFFLWIFLGDRRTWRGLLLSAALIALMILPFTAYNYARFGEFVLLNTNAGYAFYWGNHPVYGTRFLPILPWWMGTYYDLLPPELLHLNEAALDKALLQRGIGFVLQDPLRYVLLSASRIPAYFMFWPSADSGTISNLSRMASFGIFWPFMLYGLLRAVREHGLTLKPPSPLVLVGSFALVYSLIHILSWALVRYRLPVDAVLVIFAALAVVGLAQHVPVLRRLLQVNA